MSKLHKKFKFFIKINKERDWLEEMALKGYMLEDIKMGMFYTFRQDTPKHMLYEMDRFNLGKNPTREEMLAKKNFIEMATESGWREVTHDESLNYYFTKEYEEDGFNELYNDEESLHMRAEKFKKIYTDMGMLFVKIMAIVGIVLFLEDWIIVANGCGTKVDKAFLLFTVGYNVFASFMAWMYLKMADIYYEEMKMSREEIQKQKEKKRKTEIRLIMTTKGLQKYLRKHAQKGEKLVSMRMVRYTFEKVENAAVDFVLDTKGMVNERRKREGMKRLSDSKDWNLMGNDWQAESIAYAESFGLECLCAYDNRAIIYQVYDEKDIPEDMQKQRVRLFSILGGTGTVMLIAGLLGYVVGFCMGMLGF